jgi:hypothetical protein
MGLISGISTNNKAGELLVPEKTKSNLKILKDIAKTILIPFEGLKLVVALIKNTAGIVSCIRTLPPAVKSALQFVQIPGMIRDSLTAALSVEDIHTNRLLVQDLTAALRGYRKATTPEEKAAALSIALKKLDKENLKSVREMTNIGRCAKKALSQRVDALRAHIDQKNVTEDDRKLIELLASRASLHFGLSVVTLVSCCASIAGAILSLTPVPLTGQLAAASIFTACAVQALADWFIKKFCINENPFDANSRSPIMSMIKGIENKVHALGAGLQSAVASSRQQQMSHS